jgi:lipid II:glycine glycyltransferase (peptidoglycan interpeptide bridge formation enzyme)
MTDIRIIDENFDPALWNSMVTHPVQSWEWGVSRIKSGIKILRLAEYVNDSLKAVYLITIHPFLFNQKTGVLAMSALPGKELVSFLQQYCQTHKISHIKIEPYLFASDTPGARSLLGGLGLKESSNHYFYHWTILMDLRLSEDELLQQVKKQARYSIRVAEKNKVTVKPENNQQGLHAFIKLYLDTVKRQGFYGYTSRYLETVWNSMKDSISHILVAYHKEQPIGAYELFYVNGRLFYPYAGNSYEHRNLMGSNLLMWEAVKYGKSLGAVSFDMWGTNPPGNKENSAWAGFSKFKESFGGEYKELLGSYDLINDAKWYHTYHFANRIRKFYLTFKKTFTP